MWNSLIIFMCSNMRPGIAVLLKTEPAACCGVEKWSENTESYIDIDNETVYSVEQSGLANIHEPLNKVLAPIRNRWIGLVHPYKFLKCTITYHLLFSYFDRNIRYIIIILRSLRARSLILPMGSLYKHISIISGVTCCISPLQRG